MTLTVSGLSQGDSSHTTGSYVPLPDGLHALERGQPFPRAVTAMTLPSAAAHAVPLPASMAAQTQAVVTVMQAMPLSLSSAAAAAPRPPSRAESAFTLVSAAAGVPVLPSLAVPAATSTVAAAAPAMSSFAPVPSHHSSAGHTPPVRALRDRELTVPAAADGAAGCPGDSPRSRSSVQDWVATVAAAMPAAAGAAGAAGGPPPPRVPSPDVYSTLSSTRGIDKLVRNAQRMRTEGVTEELAGRLELELAYQRFRTTHAIAELRAAAAPPAPPLPDAPPPPTPPRPPERSLVRRGLEWTGGVARDSARNLVVAGVTAGGIACATMVARRVFGSAPSVPVEPPITRADIVALQESHAKDIAAIIANIPPPPPPPPPSLLVLPPDRSMGWPAAAAVVGSVAIGGGALVFAGPAIATVVAPLIATTSASIFASVSAASVAASKAIFGLGMAFAAASVERTKQGKLL